MEEEEGERREGAAAAAAPVPAVQQYAVSDAAGVLQHVAAPQQYAPQHYGVAAPQQYAPQHYGVAAPQQYAPQHYGVAAPQQYAPQFAASQPVLVQPHVPACMGDYGEDRADACTVLLVAVALLAGPVVLLATRHDAMSVVMYWLALAPGAVLFYVLYVRNRRKTARINTVARVFATGAAGAVPTGIVSLLVMLLVLFVLMLFFAQAIGNALRGLSDGDGDADSDADGEQDADEQRRRLETALERVRSQAVPLVLLACFLMAYVVAGLVEETWKFLLARHASRAPTVAHPFGVIVHAMAGALGFATIENVMYVAQGDLLTAVARAFLSVPLHVVCGMITGARLSKRVFFGDPSGYLSIIAMPVFLHGSFDFTFFVLAVWGRGPEVVAVPLVVCPALLALGVWYYRRVSKEAREWVEEEEDGGVGEDLEMGAAAGTGAAADAGSENEAAAETEAETAGLLSH